MFLHQLFGKGFARLYLCSFFGRAKNGNTDSLKMVDNTISQRCLRPDNDQFNALFLSNFTQPIYVVGANIQVPGNLSRAGITRSGINLFCFGALGQLPDQGMLPSPTPNNQYFYLPHPLVLYVIASPSATGGGEAISFLSTSSPCPVCHCESIRHRRSRSNLTGHNISPAISSLRVHPPQSEAKQSHRS